RWLEPSDSFRGTTDISSNPVTLGASYREEGPRGVRHGTVTEVKRPTRITFRQPMTMRYGLGTIDIVRRHTLSPLTDAAHEQRGRVGKPTTAVNLAASVADGGYETLHIDLDAQCNATVALGVSKDCEPNVYEALAGEAPLQDGIVPTCVPGLWLAPASPDLAG